MTTGVLHVYNPSRHLNLFEHTPYASSSPTISPAYPAPPPKRVLLFIGGLFDTFNNPRFVGDLARLFPLHAQQQWRVMHVQLSSNGRAFGLFSLDRDVEEIAQCITYIRGTLFKDASLSIVLMGHSTGCQDIIRYLTAPNPLKEGQDKRPIVQGAILQAPVSDRESFMHTINKNPEVKKAYEAAMEIIKGTPKKDHWDVLLPMNIARSFYGLAPLSLARFLSLLSPTSPENPSVEDIFSSDLSDATLQSTFGKIGRNGLLSRSNQPDDAQSILVLLSDSDEYAHPRTSQRDLLDRFRGVMREETAATVHGDSAVILNAVHDVGGDDWLSQEARLVVLRRKVLRYLKDVVGDVDAHADEIWHKEGDRVTAMKAGDGRKVEEIVGDLKL